MPFLLLFRSWAQILGALRVSSRQQPYTWVWLQDLRLKDLTV